MPRSPAASRWNWGWHERRPARGTAHRRRRHRFDRRLQGRGTRPGPARGGRRRRGHADPVRGPVRRAADVRGPLAPPGRDGPAGPAAGRPDRPHRRSPTRPTRSSSLRRPPTGSARWPTAWPATSSPPRASRPRRRSSSPRRWTATCGRIPRRGPTSPASATTSATRSSPPADGPLASGQSGVGRLAETAAIVEAVVAAVADRPIRAADPAARPPLVRARPRRRSRGSARRRDRRRDARGDRPGPVHRQSLDGPHGRRDRPGRAWIAAPG